MIVLLHLLSIKSAWHLDSTPSPEIPEEDSIVAVELRPNLGGHPTQCSPDPLRMRSPHRAGSPACAGCKNPMPVFCLQLYRWLPCVLLSPLVWTRAAVLPCQRRWHRTVQSLVHSPCSKATALAAIQGVTFQAVRPH